MGGLIPFMLKPTTGASHRHSVATPPSHTRKTSIGGTPISILKPKAARRMSASAMPLVLPMLPATHNDWKRAIMDVKRAHLTRKFRVCATRCNEILDNVKDKTQIEPVYLVYLHFYAAVSLEMCAQHATAASPYRASLLNQAREHFARAAELVQVAESSVLDKSRSYSVLSHSTISSCHSPTESVSSQTWTAETSPTSSICSLDDLASKTLKPKRVKKVSFSLPCEEEPASRIPSLFVRPDSPTLGFEDEYFVAGAARQALPEIPPFKGPRQSTLLKEPLFTHEEEDQFEAAVNKVRSVGRYCDMLAGLKTHLASHASSLQESRRASIYGAPSDNNVDLQEVDKKLRIERLRKNGWQRKRFDASRYEELCEAVLAELA